MIKRLTLLVVMLLVSVPVVAETVDTAWVRRYNGPGTDDDEAFAIAVDDSGYVYVTGYSYGEENNKDYATIKYYPNGDTVWVRRYNGPGNDDEWARALTIDSSYNVYVTGYSVGSGTAHDYTTIKYYPNGDTAWLRRYNGPENSTDDAYAIAVDDSGYVYVIGASYAGGSNADYCTIKYLPNGDTAWVRRYNGPENYADHGYAISVDRSGNVYVTGSSCDTVGYLDYVTIKYAPNGDTLWLRRYKGPGEDYDEAYALAIDSAGNVYVTGYSVGSGTGRDYATIKYYSNGDTAWVRRYNGPPGNGDDRASAIAVDDSQNVYVTGYSDGTGTFQDYATIKYDSSGNELWVKRYNKANGTDQPWAIAVDDSDNVYVTGASGGGLTGMDYATIKYYSNGDTAWVMRYNGPANDWDYAKAIAVDDSGNVYVTGYCVGIGTDDDYCTIKYSPKSTDVKDETEGQEKPSEFGLSQNYPNPFNPTTKIEFTLARSGFVSLNIYDILGRKVKTLVSEHLPSGYKSVIWDGKNDDGKEVASGVYFYQLRVGDFSEPKKMVLLK